MAGGVLSQGLNASSQTDAGSQSSLAGAPPLPAQNRIPSTPTSTTGTGSAPSLSSLYPTAPTPSTFSASTGTAATTGPAPTANAQMTGPVAGIQNGQINPNDSTNAASQLDAITKANSPYIQQATQAGLLSAASRGLENSSLGAGAAEASAVQAAAPLAEENAQSATGAALQNSQLGTQASEFNAGQENANEQLNAQLNTQTNQFNASQKQTADATNAAAANTIKQQTEAIIGQLNQQYLSGNQAQILAGIQGQYSELIAQNQSAASLTQSVLTGINASLSNQNIDAGRASSNIQANLSILNSALGMLNTLNGGNSGAVPSVSGSGATVSPVTPPNNPGVTPGGPRPARQK